jgi:hypothetical protein
MGSIDSQLEAFSGKLRPKHMKTRRDGSGQTLL